MAVSGIKAGNAYVEIYADASRLQNSLNQMQRKFGGLEKSISTVFSNAVRGMGAFVAASASIGTVVASLKSLQTTMMNIDEVAKTARGLGTSYNDLRAFQLAAGEFAGVDGPAAAEMLAKLNRRAGEFRLGLGEGAKAFELLGISLDEVRNRSPVELLKRVQDAMRGIKSPAEQAAIAVRLFESEGKKLLPLLTASNGELDSYVALLEKLGLAISEDDIARIEKANDNFARLQLQFEGMQTSILSSDAAMGIWLTTLQSVSNELGKVGVLAKGAAQAVSAVGIMTGFGAGNRRENKGETLPGGMTMNIPRENSEFYPKAEADEPPPPADLMKLGQDIFEGFKGKIESGDVDFASMLGGFDQIERERKLSDLQRQQDAERVAEEQRVQEAERMQQAEMLDSLAESVGGTRTSFISDARSTGAYSVEQQQLTVMQTIANNTAPLAGGLT